MSKYGGMEYGELVDSIADKQDFTRWMVKNHWSYLWAASFCGGAYFDRLASVGHMIEYLEAQDAE